MSKVSTVTLYRTFENECPKPYPLHLVATPPGLSTRLPLPASPASSPCLGFRFRFLGFRGLSSLSLAFLAKRPQHLLPFFFIRGGGLVHRSDLYSVGAGGFGFGVWGLGLGFRVSGQSTYYHDLAQLTELPQCRWLCGSKLHTYIHTYIHT